MTEITFATTEELRNDFRGGIERLEKLIESADERSQEIVEKNLPLTVELSLAENDFVIDKMHGVHGLTRNPEKIEFDISTEGENWTEFLKSQYAHEYAHTLFMDHLNLEYESNIENWQHILLEAQGQLFAEKAYPDIKPEWRTKFSQDEISEKWETIKDKIGTKIFSESIFHSEENHPWLGYSLSYHVGQELIEQGHGLEDFPELEKEDVIQAGNKLFSK